MTVPSLNLYDSLKSRSPMHISRMIGESSLWHSKFLSISIIASSTNDSLNGFAFFSSSRKMSKLLKHSITASGYLSSTFFSKRKLSMFISDQRIWGTSNTRSKGMILEAVIWKISTYDILWSIIWQYAIYSSSDSLKICCFPLSSSTSLLSLSGIWACCPFLSYSALFSHWSNSLCISWSTWQCSFISTISNGETALSTLISCSDWHTTLKYSRKRGLGRMRIQWFKISRYRRRKRATESSCAVNLFYWMKSRT